MRAAACESWREIDLALVLCLADGNHTTVHSVQQCGGRGDCTDAELGDQGKCFAKVYEKYGLDLGEMKVKGTFCKYAKDLNSCYPKCYCDNAACKTLFDFQSEMIWSDCKDIKCGSAASSKAGLPASAVLVVAAVALVAAH